MEPADMQPAKTEAEQAAFFQEFHRAFCQASNQTDEIEFFYCVAGTTIRLRFAGLALVPYVTPALDHLRIASIEAPDLTLCLWDSASTGIPGPPPICPYNAFTDRGDIWGFNSDRIKTAFHWSDFSVNIFDHESKVGVYWIQNAKTQPYWTSSTPVRTLLHWHFERHGGQLVHAAAVGTEDGAVLIAGRGGIGKSTTALSCLGAGFNYLGDDYVVIRASDPPTVYSLYCTAKLNADHVVRFPDLQELVSNPDKLNEEKAVIWLHPRFAGLIKQEMILKAILTLRFGDGVETSVSPAPPLIFRQALCFTTMCQLPYVGRHTYEFCDRLCRSLPGYVLELGRDVDKIPLVISNLLHGTDKPVAKKRSRPRIRRDVDHNPLVSVVIPVYNREAFIEEALNNVVSQNYPANEIIVVDDGSTDATESIVRQFPSDIRYFRQDNAGPGSARNRGIKDSTGELIAFLDSDDLWPENNLQMLVNELMQDSELDVVHGYAQLMEYSPEKNTYRFRGSPKDVFDFYLGAGLYRKRVFTEVGLFDHELRYSEDLDWYNRVREFGKNVRRVDAVTLFVRRHGVNMTRGRTLVEMNLLRTFKKQRDRLRSKNSTMAASPVAR